jgi:hypothetical protein
MDRAQSIGAAVIWSISVPVSCPASWAARSRWCRAVRVCSRSYRQASGSVSRALICRSMSGYRACLTAADHEVVAVGLGEQLAERRGGGSFVGAGLLEASRLAGNRVGSGVDVDPEGPAGKRSMWPRAVVAMAAR